MPLARDLSGLPTRTENGGWPPDEKVRFVDVLAKHLMDEEIAAGPRPKAVTGTRFRHSDAGGCARAIAYAALEVPPSNPAGLGDYWVMGLGKLLHGLLEERLHEQGVLGEIKVSIDGFDGSGHADGVVTGWIGAGPDGQAGKNPGEHYRIVAEYKTIDGYSYKLAVGERGPAKGPQYAYVLQAALNGLGLDADEVVVGLLSRDVISRQWAERKHLSETQRFCAEWTLTRQEYDPLARKEMERVSGILALLDEGQLPARKIPDPELPLRHLVTDPQKGTWIETLDGVTVLDAGTTWHCMYCRWQDTCAQTPAGRTPVSVLGADGLGVMDA